MSEGIYNGRFEQWVSDLSLHISPGGPKNHLKYEKRIPFYCRTTAYTHSRDSVRESHPGTLIKMTEQTQISRNDIHHYNLQKNMRTKSPPEAAGLKFLCNGELLWKC